MLSRARLGGYGRRELKGWAAMNDLGKESMMLAN
jgi:hypothetical protein